MTTTVEQGEYKVNCVYLMAELVAGYSQNDESLSREALIQLVHLGVIPGGRASERRHVLDEDHFTL